MNRDKLIDILFEKGKARDIEEMEVYINKKSSMNINIYEGDLERYTLSDEENLSLRGIYKGKMGYSYTEKLKEESLDELLDNLIQYAENNSRDYLEKISSHVLEKQRSKEKPNNLDKFTEEEKIEYLLDLEKRVYNLDKRVKTVSSCSYSETREGIYIKNTKGLELEDSHRIATINLGVVAQEGSKMETGYSHHVFNELKEEYKDVLIRDAAGDALAMLGAEAIEAGNREIILRNNVVADLFSNFVTIFYGNTVEKDLSLMKGKIGQEVAVEDLNMIEDPLMELSNICRFFDDEGTLTSRKHIIEKGVLKTFLHNNETAGKSGVGSTGNGFRNSHKSSIGILSTNMYIEEGDKSLDDLVAEMDKGVIITEIHGLHAGINPTSGDFSLSSNGLLVEDGKIIRPLAQITMAGNLYKMLKNIKGIANDTKFSHPSSNYFGSPSIYVGSLAIAGK